jgi:hypothetical protein
VWNELKSGYEIARSKHKYTNRTAVGKGASDQTQTTNAQSGRGQAIQIQTKTNKAPSAPPQVQGSNVLQQTVNAKINLRALNLRGRARGFLGFGLCLDRLPPARLRFFSYVYVVSLAPFPTGLNITGLRARRFDLKQRSPQTLVSTPTRPAHNKRFPSASPPETLPSTQQTQLLSIQSRT